MKLGYSGNESLKVKTKIGRVEFDSLPFEEFVLGLMDDCDENPKTDQKFFDRYCLYHREYGPKSPMDEYCND